MLDGRVSEREYNYRGARDDSERWQRHMSIKKESASSGAGHANGVCREGIYQGAVAHSQAPKKRNLACKARKRDAS